MNKQIFLKKWLTPFLLIFIMFLGVLISSKNVLAENKNVDVNIKEFEERRKKHVMPESKIKTG